MRAPSARRHHVPARAIVALAGADPVCDHCGAPARHRWTDTIAGARIILAAACAQSTCRARGRQLANRRLVALRRAEAHDRRHARAFHRAPTIARLAPDWPARLAALVDRAIDANGGRP